MDVKTKRRLSTEGKGLLASAIGGGAAGGAAAAPAVPAAESKAPAAPARAAASAAGGSNAAGLDAKLVEKFCALVDKGRKGR